MAQAVIDKKREMVGQFLSFSVIMSIGDLMLWDIFFSTLLFTQTDDFSVIITSWLLRLVSLYIGYVIASFTQERFGYRNQFRFAFLLIFLNTILLVPFLDDLSSYYIIVSILVGFPRGIFWAAEHTVKLKEIHGIIRGRVINNIQTSEMLLGIILPVMVGSLIEFNDSYSYVFILAASVYFFGIIYPWKYNKKPRSKIRSFEIRRIMNQRHFGKFAFVQLFNGAQGAIAVATVSVLPIFFLDSEFQVGGLISLTGFISAAVIFFHRNDAIKNKLRWGYIGYGILNIGNLALAIIWTPLFLVIRSVSRSLGFPIGDVAFVDLDYRVREKLLGDFKNESAIEMNLVVETLYVISRIMGMGAIIFLLNAFSDNQDSVVRAVFLFFAFGNVFKLFVLDRLNRKVKIT